MPAFLTKNRRMFWRIIRRLLESNPGRLFVILLALGTGAAVTAALLNLQVDAKRRLTTEFRVLGPNVIVAPRTDSDSAEQPHTFPESFLKQVPKLNEGNQIVSIGSLYLIANAVPYSSQKGTEGPPIPVVVAGYTGGTQQQILDSTPKGTRGLTDGLPYCDLGIKVASTLHVHEGDKLILRNGPVEEACYVRYVLPYGGQEDNQISVHIETAQRLARLPGQVGLIQIIVPGTAQSIGSFINKFQKQLPDVDVRPIRQFTEAEAKIYDRISGLLTATVALVLLLTGLCVMAAMTNVAMERRNDVGLMKAIGGASRRVLRLFLAEAALLGLIGGLLGATAGIALSIGLGKAVFGVAARPRLIVYPVAVALTIIVAIAGAFPLRRLTSIRPASVFRGEA
jgi:putative ABC transport system permease protein